MSGPIPEFLRSWDRYTRQFVSVSYFSPSKVPTVVHLGQRALPTHMIRPANKSIRLCFVIFDALASHPLESFCTTRKGFSCACGIVGRTVVGVGSAWYTVFCGRPASASMFRAVDEDSKLFSSQFQHPEVQWRGQCSSVVDTALAYASFLHSYYESWA